MTLTIFLHPTVTAKIHPKHEISALAKLLACASMSSAAISYDDYFCESLQVARQNDYPIASLMRSGEGCVVDDGYWLLATPVHLVLQRDSFSLHPLVETVLQHEESLALIQTLNAHFAVDGIVFELGAQGHWYLRMSADPQLHTFSPLLAINRDISTFMPQGQGSAKWHQLLNEMQMLLFSHPVNQRREQSGELPINSVWISGGGFAPSSQSVLRSTIAGFSLLAKGIAGRADSSLNEPESLVQNAIQTASDMVLEVSDLDEQESVFRILLNTLRRFKLQKLEICYMLDNQIVVATVSPFASWQLWRKPSVINAYFNPET